MIRLTQLALRFKSVTLLIAAALFLMGLVSWGSLRQELLPDIQLPIVTVVSAMPGSSADDVASQVTAPIERALANVPRLEGIQSTSANSLSLVVAQFSFGTNVKDTMTTIDQQLRSVALPDGTQPQVAALDLNDQPVVVASIAAPAGVDPVTVATIARSEIVPAVQAVEGVSSVDLTGGATQMLTIRLRPADLASSRIPVDQIIGVLRANQIAIPAGTMTDDGMRLPVTVGHRFASVAELEALIVGASATTPPTPVTLGQLADIALEDVQVSGYARTDGQPALTLTVSKASGANTVQVADAVQAVLAEAQAGHPDDVRIETIQDLSGFIKESSEGLVREGLLGALFAVLTIFLFLLSMRSTLVAAVSIPLSILTAIALFGVADLTINIITLGGLAVAVGRVVDDSIVVLENIYRHRARGDDIDTAVLNGTREVAAAITSSTITTVMVFLPIGFVGGIVSQFFLPFGIAVTLALLASLGVALTVIPVLAWIFVRRVHIQLDPDGELPETIWQRLYTPVLTLALRSNITRWATVAIALVLFVGSLALTPLLPTAFIDVGGEKTLLVTIQPPAGASSADVSARTAQAEALLLPSVDPDVERIQSTIPGDADTGLQTLQAAFTGGSALSATMTVRLHDDVDVVAKAEAIEATLEPITEGGYSVQVSESQAFGGAGGLSIVVSGADPAAIRTASDAIVADFATLPGTKNVHSDLAADATIVAVDVRPERAALLGLSAAQVGGQLRTILTSQSLGTVTLADGTSAETRILVDTTGLDSVEALRQVPVQGSVGSAPLGQVADVATVQSQGSVTRVDGSPAATITGAITSDDQGGVSLEAQQRVDALIASGAIPDGVTIRFAGVTAQQSEAFGSLFLAMAVAILAVYLVMVLVFGSLVDPLVILFSLPLATIGAFPALLLTDRPIGISALIGFLMLIGIVVTNAIVLLDLVEQLRHKGMSTHQALLQGGRTRVRPILMTAVATILALTPVALGFSEGSIIAAELGTVVIGGLFSSTILTLVVIPVVYMLVDGAKQRVAGRFAGFLADGAATTPSETPSETPAG
ncbi:MAG: efflux RND transporter permease subunit [Chloroflexi bacterium]|nr:efflux RND transporter permease subunit [Chloroflexota bacterium]